MNPDPSRSVGRFGTLTLIVCVAVLAILTVVAVWDVGLIGIFASILDSWASVQIFVDLLILCGLAIAWMYSDSRTSGRRLWPWVALTLVAGAFGPLGYLLAGRRRLITQASDSQVKRL